MCQVLKVSESGFYKWRGRGESIRAKAEVELLRDIKRIHKKSWESYGTRRIKEDLAREGKEVSEGRISRIKQKYGIYAKGKRKYTATTDSRHGLPVYENLLQQDFLATAPNRVWVSDITYIPTDEGWLYLATHIDLFDRKVVGMAMSDSLKRDIVIKSFYRAIADRKPSEGLICHSDRGVQYASEEYRELLRSYKIRGSMSRRGNCYDNAPAESFHATIKKELIYSERFRTRQEAATKIFEYIEVFYNRQRLHYALGYQTPHEYWQKFASA